MNAILLTAPRLLFAMAEQGQLPRVMMTTHRRYKTPFAAILITALGMLVLTLSGTFASAATLSTIIRLVTYAVTCAALPILRRRDSQGSVRFVAPAGIFVAITAVVLVAWLLLSSSWPDARMGLIAAAGGLLLYVAMPRRRQAQL
jgi:amino acid transporter